MLHAADVSALTDVKAELEGFTAKLRQSEEQARDASERLAMEKVKTAAATAVLCSRAHLLAPSPAHAAVTLLP